MPMGETEAKAQEIPNATYVTLQIRYSTFYVYVTDQLSALSGTTPTSPWTN